MFNHLKQFFTGLVSKAEHERHFVFQRLIQRIDVPEKIAENLLAVIKNPIVDSLLKTILPPTITDHIPQAEAFLVKAIEDMSIGMKIEKDIASATTNEDKVRIFLEDLKTLSENHSQAIIAKVVSLLLAAIDDNELKQNLYDVFVQAHYSEKKVS